MCPASTALITACRRQGRGSAPPKPVLSLTIRLFFAEVTVYFVGADDSVRPTLSIIE